MEMALTDTCLNSLLAANPDSVFSSPLRSQVTITTNNIVFGLLVSNFAIFCKILKDNHGFCSSNNFDETTNAISTKVLVEEMVWFNEVS